MLKIVRNRRTSSVQNLLLIVTGSWLLPVLVLLGVTFIARCV